jgi:hypothetical protein
MIGKKKNSNISIRLTRRFLQQKKIKNFALGQSWSVGQIG